MKQEEKTAILYWQARAIQVNHEIKGIEAVQELYRKNGMPAEAEKWNDKLQELTEDWEMYHKRAQELIESE